LRFCAQRLNPFRVLPVKMTLVIPGLPRLNPRLKLANTFGVTLEQSILRCDWILASV